MNIRHIGFTKGECVFLLPLQPVLRPDPHAGEVTRDPASPNIFRRPFFTEGDYQQHVKRRLSNEQDV